MNKITPSLIAGIGATIAIGLLSLIDSTLKETVLIMAPFGATTVLVFGLPDSPLAQPKNVILGHLITAFIGVVFTQIIGVTPFTLALATGFGVSAMLLTKTTHPPAGANPLLIMLSGQSWAFLITPVLIGAITIVLTGKVMQKCQKRWLFKNTAIHLSK
ncbi:HPP family protein [Vibrio casei]|uniref:HPP family protein n=1 Tax=Vibrio casei TaxID=673372 RepID=UPI003F96458E